ncbi:MAG TPA: malonyl-ACP O-methyltransferase BioC [Burkholderiales bacterium]|nr:malonyl-ACP O-methyltransferase BioC [Burkholderiales bacterium]
MAERPEVISGVDKRLVRLSFERAASSYDAHAVLQREIADRMMARLDYIKHQPKILLDAGSGTGFGTQGLRNRYPEAGVIALDLATAMLKIANPPQNLWQKMRRRSSIYSVCGDIDALPLKTSSVDMIWSSLALQWCNDLNVSFAELYRVLAPGGLLMFATFGPDTLNQLRSAFASVDGYTHVNSFVDMHDIGDVLVSAGFNAPVMDMEYITLTYTDLKTMLHELKAIGAHNVTGGRNPGLTGRERWRNLEAAFEQFRTNGRLPATYEVIYGHAWINQKLPRAARSAEGYQIVQMDLRGNSAGQERIK